MCFINTDGPDDDDVLLRVELVSLWRSEDYKLKADSCLVNFILEEHSQ